VRESRPECTETSAYALQKAAQSIQYRKYPRLRYPWHIRKKTHSLRSLIIITVLCLYAVKSNEKVYSCRHDVIQPPDADGGAKLRIQERGRARGGEIFHRWLTFLFPNRMQPTPCNTPAPPSAALRLPPSVELPTWAFSETCYYFQTNLDPGTWP
jgi:hypothetical protein